MSDGRPRPVDRVAGPSSDRVVGAPAGERPAAGPPEAHQRPGRAAPTRNPAGAVYGTVIAGSVIAAESAGGVELLRLSLVVIVTLFVYWAAHVYAELLSRRILLARAPSGAEALELLKEETSIIGASLVPLSVLLMAAGLGASDDAAVNTSMWSIVVLLAGWAWVAGRRSNLHGLELGGYVVLSGAIGCMTVVLKLLLH